MNEEHEQTLAEFVAERDAALDGLHVARYNLKSLAPELRHASRAYLVAEGFTYGILPEGELPS